MSDYQSAMLRAGWLPEYDDEGALTHWTDPADNRRIYQDWEIEIIHQVGDCPNVPRVRGAASGQEPQP